MENLLRFRLEKIAQYLTTSDMSMREIAEEPGFLGASYMTEMLKKYMVFQQENIKKD